MSKNGRNKLKCKEYKSNNISVINKPNKKERHNINEAKMIQRKRTKFISKLIDKGITVTGDETLSQLRKLYRPLCIVRIINLRHKELYKELRNQLYQGLTIKL